MTERPSPRWVLVCGCLLWTACGESFHGALPRSSADESKKPESATSNEGGKTRRRAIASRGVEQQLSIRIDLDAAEDSLSIDIDKPFRVVLANSSDQPVRIWNPRTRNGYYQLSFHFVNSQIGEKHFVRKRQIKDDQFLLEGNIEPGAEAIEIAGMGDFAAQVRFSDIEWGARAWTGLPNPNSGGRFSISAQFESSVVSQRPGKPIWVGIIRSDNVTANFVASRLKTPHDYLRNGFPGKALEIMKADRAWVTRGDKHMPTPLHVAAGRGHVEVVKWLLDNGADVNAIDIGYTPLHGTSHRKVIELILERKPDLNVRSRSRGQTPLQEAAADLVAAANVNEKRKWQEIVDTYLDAGAEYDILTAIHLEDLERVKTILTQTPERADSFQAQSPLRTAASLGRLEICRYLIEHHRVDVNDFERGMGYPIIKEALARLQVARLLIENGADLQTRITWRGGSTGVQIIGDDATALHFAASDSVPETVKLLIDNGVDIFATAQDPLDENEQQTALEVAAFFGRGDNAEAILNHPQFDRADQRLRQRLLDKSLLIGAFPSWLARNPDRPKLIEALLKKGANPNASEEGVTAVQIAAREIGPNKKDENEDIKKVVAALVQRGATLDLFSAVAIGEQAEVARLLKQDPASANSRGPDGYPALHFAVDMDFENMVKALLNAGGDVDIRSKSDITGYVNETPLHCAAFWGRYEIAKLLIDAGADVNALSVRKSTPLHNAASGSHARLTRLLLENGAKVDSKDEDGKTPLDWCPSDTDHVKEILRGYRETKEK